MTTEEFKKNEFDQLIDHYHKELEILYLDRAVYILDLLDELQNNQIET